MTPDQLAKQGTEGAHQSAFMAWCQQYKQEPRLMFAFHIPNGGLRTAREGYRLVAQGVRKGVPDIFIPIPSAGFHGLWIEFKRGSGVMSEHQIKWQDFLISQNYFHIVAYDYLQAVDATLKYLSHK